MAKSKAPAKADGGKIRHLYLVDGSGYLFRAYHALPPMTRPDGTPINAVYGFSRMLVQLLDDPEETVLATLSPPNVDVDAEDDAEDAIEQETGVVGEGAEADADESADADDAADE